MTPTATACFDAASRRWGGEAVPVLWSRPSPSGRSGHRHPDARTRTGGGALSSGRWGDLPADTRRAMPGHDRATPCDHGDA